MPRISQIKSDVSLEKAGRWVPFGEPDEVETGEIDSDGKPVMEEVFIELKIARMGNPSYEKKIGVLRRSDAKKMVRNGKIDANALEPHIKEAMSQFILMDWRNMIDDDGREIPFSSEKALELFNDPSMRELYEFVREESSDNEAYRLAAQEEAAKN